VELEKRPGKLTKNNAGKGNQFPNPRPCGALPKIKTNERRRNVAKVKRKAHQEIKRKKADQKRLKRDKKNLSNDIASRKKKREKIKSNQKGLNYGACEGAKRPNVVPHW